jgi:Cys-tRNA(Pro)/Cys-tRNA(Cys) deacylase
VTRWSRTAIPTTRGRSERVLTPATKALDSAGIPYQAVEYEIAANEGGYGAAVVDALGLDPDAVGKTLVAELDGHAVIAVVPVSRSLDLKALARAGSSKRAVMAEPAVAERLTGYVVGGIAPLGHRKRLSVFVDELLLGGDAVHVSAGRRGLELTLSPVDLVRVTAATVAPISS